MKVESLIYRQQQTEQHLLRFFGICDQPLSRVISIQQSSMVFGLTALILSVTAKSAVNTNTTGCFVSQVKTAPFSHFNVFDFQNSKAGWKNIQQTVKGKKFNLNIFVMFQLQNWAGLSFKEKVAQCLKYKLSFFKIKV